MPGKAKIKKSKNKTSGKLINYIVELLSETLNPSTAEEVKNALNNSRSNIDNIIETPVKKSQIKIKDPNLPKRSKSSYIYFCIENRNKIKEENPELSAKEIIRELGKKWRSISSTKKKKYETMAQKDKTRYEKELANYVPSEEFKKVVNKPKRAMSSYLFFCQEQRSIIRKNNPEMSTKEITAQLGKKWRELDDKSVYEKMSRDEKDRLNKKLDKISEEKNSEEDNKKPKKKSKSGYSTYFKMNKEEYEEEGMTKKEINTKLRAIWKTLSSKEKEKYRQKCSRK